MKTNEKKENKLVKATKKGCGKVMRFLSMSLTMAMFYVTTVGATAASPAPSPAPAGGDAAETLWTTLTALIGKWVLRLGGVVVFVGGVMFALGWKNDDAEQKTRGIQTVIAGAIVMALAGMVDIFFA